MKTLTAREIKKIVKATTCKVSEPSSAIDKLLTDSRRLVAAEGTLFFAIPTKFNSGCNYVEELYSKGVRNFVLPAESSATHNFDRLSDANMWYVKDVVRALQMIAKHHREQFAMEVIGITGSNGKTVVKDWMVQLLSEEHKVASSPKSYNSQIGVPLSVWQIQDDDDIAVIEAGISKPAEMENLRNVIEPTIGVFTNVGQAHEENFLTHKQKIAEKLQLFTHCKALIYCADHRDLYNEMCEQECMRSVAFYSWGREADCNVVLEGVEYGNMQTCLTVKTQAARAEVTIPFSDYASVENAMHCITLMTYLGYDLAEVARRCETLAPVEMRLEMNEGINNCLLVNDSYSLDLNSLTIALDFVCHERQHYNKTLIMSDFRQGSTSVTDLYAQVALLIQQKGISKFVGIGPDLMRCKELFGGMKASFFASTEEFLLRYDMSDFDSETILLKGARVFRFENIAKILQRKSHETIMEVNLDAMIGNLNYYRSRLSAGTKLMAMVKASSYGAGMVEVANTLQFANVDYLTVAYSDEGVELRRNGIRLPIMVMNPEEESFVDMVKYRLEPDIYSFRVLRSFAETVQALGYGGERYPVHIELDTGMHRLGFLGDDIEELGKALKSLGGVLRVKSLFSHLACSEDPAMDDFTNKQIDTFRTWSSRLKAILGSEGILCHILNSSGITRFPEAQMDMVRLGIGLYGISPEPEVQSHIHLVSRLKTKISQVKPIAQGESVGYNRRWIAERPSRIAIIPIGYADGLHRHLGYGRGKVQIGGKEAPIIGSICMDMCFIDVTDVPCGEGDEVVIFGDAKLLHSMSQAADTITYEMLTAISPRVKRVYYRE